MKIERLILENFRGVGKALELPLEPDLTVLAGVNGSGKSTVLDALAILLSWVVARVRRAGGSGQQISELSIHNGAGYARIRAESSVPENLSWQLVKTRKGHAQPAKATELEALSKYTRLIQQQISETQSQCNIPIFSYYPVNRAVLDIPLRIRQSHDFGLLDAWDGSLVGAVNFRHFFEWFRNRQDFENEKTTELLQEIFESSFRLLENGNLVAFQDIQLTAVRQALQVFLPNFERLTVHRKPLRMTAVKNNHEVQVDQLSDGERCLIALIGDLARRLAIANPNMANPLKGEGVVLIDEIDLHIHPAWQRTILKNLTRTFPNCQFVVSTHSPQVLGEAEGRQIRLLVQDEENGLTYSTPQQAKGLSSNEILDELMRPDGDTLARNSEIQRQLDDLFLLIDQDKFKEAKVAIARMKQELQGDIPELVRADALLFMLEPDDQA
ncbi:AAA family ATPase [Methylomagnum ishizawai]|uniref:AAA family ATPase n=1 Tax=Methylomagnum ishizawai TaxID=1760988 RepID=UPI001C3229D1|nr:AAA family ATPase [Methylomagnum ishizawai]BBL73272.1 ATPase [Methylomagnum ishizawai]